MENANHETTLGISWNDRGYDAGAGFVNWIDTDLIELRSEIEDWRETAYTDWSVNEKAGWEDIEYAHIKEETR